MVELEANDAIATAAHQLAAAPRVERILITGVDKDMCQCVVGERIGCWDRFQGVVLEEARSSPSTACRRLHPDHAQAVPGNPASTASHAALIAQPGSTAMR
jgi:hypothetical protein